jgi:hypothetical protein
LKLSQDSNISEGIKMNNQKAREFVEIARRVAEEEASWADWHNVLFGTDGKFVEMFPTEAERKAFSESRLYAEIEKIEATLREKKSIGEYTVPVTTASGKFVVRLPKSLHEALTNEARAEGVSLNQLVVSKLAISLCAATKELFAKSDNNVACTN